MDRVIVYPGGLPQDTDFLSIQRNAMVSDGDILAAIMGSATSIDGLQAAPTIPGSMSILIGPGSIVSNAVIDSTPFGTLDADNSPIVKLGINTDVTVLPFAAPTAPGQSIKYLVEVSYGEIDDLALLIPYYNATKPTIPLLGPDGSGVKQNTRRKQIVQIQVKTGAPSATPTVPSVDSGRVPLYVVTVPYGASSLNSSNIAPVVGTPRLDLKVPQLFAEIKSAITQSGLVFDPSDATQLWQAIQRAASGSSLSYTPIRQGSNDVIVMQWDPQFGAVKEFVNGQYVGLLLTAEMAFIQYQPKGDYATHSDLGSYATRNDLTYYQRTGDYATHSDLAAYQHTLGFTPVTQGSGNRIILTWDGDAINIAVDSTGEGQIANRSWVDDHYQARDASLVRTTDFHLTGGVLSLPNGYIIQTFNGLLGSGSQANFSFPFTFPNGVLGVFGNINSNGDPQASLQTQAINNSTCQARLTGSGGGLNGVNFIAFGQ